MMFVIYNDGYGYATKGGVIRTRNFSKDIEKAKLFMKLGHVKASLTHTEKYCKAATSTWEIHRVEFKTVECHKVSEI